MMSEKRAAAVRHLMVRLEMLHERLRYDNLRPAQCGADKLSLDRLSWAIVRFRDADREAAFALASSRAAEDAAEDAGCVTEDPPKLDLRDRETLRALKVAAMGCCADVYACSGDRQLRRSTLVALYTELARIADQLDNMGTSV